MNKIIGLAIAAVLGLSACSNLDHKTAHEVMSISNDRILKEDRSFNITGSSRIYISPLAEAVLADEKVEKKAEEKAKDAKEIKGSILEVKDFMFSIKTDDGKEYALNFDKAPEGLSEVKEGDEVTVETQAGVLEYKVLSVEKSNEE